MMSFEEHCLRFDCAGESLVGILSQPERPLAVGLVIVVGGPQYRAGSHRQFALLARRLASAGHAVLRFDYRGMGDSGGGARDFEGIEPDISAAMQALLKARPEIRRVALWGLCDAASAALMYAKAQSDLPVAGLVLANPWVRSTATLAATHVKHYYGKRLLQKDFWRKLLLGGVGAAAITGVVRNLLLATGRGGAPSTGSFQARMAASFARPRVPMLILLSTDDLTAKEFSDMFPPQQLQSEASAAGKIDHRLIAGADHTFSTAAHYKDVLEMTTTYLRSLKGETA